MKTKWIVPATLFLLATGAFATEQIGDELTLNGTKVTVYGFALRTDMAATFDKNRPKVWSSANWDGWYAKLALRDGKLYLIGLDMDRPDNPWPFNGPSIRRAFGVRIPKEGLHAGWFTGDLEESFGEERVRIRSFEQGVLKTTMEDDSDFAKWLRSKKEEERDSGQRTRGQQPSGAYPGRAPVGASGTPQEEHESDVR